MRAGSSKAKQQGTAAKTNGERKRCLRVWEGIGMNRELVELAVADVGLCEIDKKDCQRRIRAADQSLYRKDCATVNTRPTGMSTGRPSEMSR